MNFIIDVALDIYFDYYCNFEEALHHSNNLFDEFITEPHIQFLQLRCLI